MGINGYLGAGMDGKLDAHANKLKENKKLVFKVYFERVAVTEEQINEYKLRRDPTKMSDDVQDKLEYDPRTESFRRKYRKVLPTEVDALPVLHSTVFGKIVIDVISKIDKNTTERNTY